MVAVGGDDGSDNRCSHTRPPKDFSITGYTYIIWLRQTCGSLSQCLLFKKIPYINLAKVKDVNNGI